MIIFFFLFFICESLQQLKRSQFQKIQSCIGCRMIWENIQETLGGNKNQILAIEAFQSTCKMQPEMFFSACTDMFEIILDMSQQFSQDQTIDQMCINNKLCYPELRQKVILKQQINETIQQKKIVNQTQDQNKETFQYHIKIPQNKQVFDYSKNKIKPIK